MSRHHSKHGWRGPIVTAARNYWHKRLLEALLMGDPIKCPKCNAGIDPRSPWDVGHMVALDAGGRIDITNTHPEHAACNRADGARITNEKVRAKKSRVRHW